MESEKDCTKMEKHFYRQCACVCSGQKTDMPAIFFKVFFFSLLSYFLFFNNKQII
jgi:hypothetical protein